MIRGSKVFWIRTHQKSQGVQQLLHYIMSCKNMLISQIMFRNLKAVIWFKWLLLVSFTFNFLLYHKCFKRPNLVQVASPNFLKVSVHALKNYTNSSIDNHGQLNSLISRIGFDIKLAFQRLDRQQRANISLDTSFPNYPDCLKLLRSIQSAINLFQEWVKFQIFVNRSLIHPPFIRVVVILDSLQRILNQFKCISTPSESLLFAVKLYSRITFYHFIHEFMSVRSGRAGPLFESIGGGFKSSIAQGARTLLFPEKQKIGSAMEVPVVEESSTCADLSNSPLEEEADDVCRVEVTAVGVGV